MLLVPADGTTDSLAYLVNKSLPEDLVLRLFVNNITPAETDVVDAYTEATWEGYSGMELEGEQWIITPGSPSIAEYPKQIFTCGADGQNTRNYGYYLTRSLSGRIAWAERFTDGPYLIADAGNFVAVTPRITQASEE